MPVKSQRTKRLIGLSFLFLTATIWVITSFISSSLVSSKSGHAAQVHPFLLTYLATSLFTLYLPFVHVRDWLSDYLAARSKRRMVDKHSYAVVHTDAQTSTKHGRHGDPRGTAREKSAARNQAMSAAAWATPLWFAAQCTFNTSLAYTSVTSNTILSSTSSLFTFGLSILLLGELYTSKKLLAILACIFGTALVTLSDNQTDQSNTPIWGDALVIISAALYAGYTVIMKKKLPGDESEDHVALFFGYVGLFSTVFLAPVVVVLLSAGAFSLSTIPAEAYGVIVLEGLLDYVLSDYLWARAVILLGPTVATLGLSIQIPIAAGAELAMGQAKWLYSYKTLLMTLSGTTLILMGFFGVNTLPSSKSESSGGGAAGSGASGNHGLPTSSVRDTGDDSVTEHDTEKVGLLAGSRWRSEQAHAASGSPPDGLVMDQYGVAKGAKVRLTTGGHHTSTGSWNIEAGLSGSVPGVHVGVLSHPGTCAAGGLTEAEDARSVKRTSQEAFHVQVGHRTSGSGLPGSHTDV